MQKTLFDLVILDLCLVENENFDVIRVLKQYLNHSQIIVVSENNSKELETAVRKTGIVFYMLKPVDTKYLKSIVALISTKLYIIRSDLVKNMDHRLKQTTQFGVLPVDNPLKIQRREPMKKIWSLALATCFMILTMTSSSVAAELDDYAGIAKGKWVIGFANDMTGNAWRGQHVAAFKEEAERMKKAGLISKYYISNVDGAAATISGLSDFVAKGVDAICSTATGPAYNSIFQEALDEDIVIATLASAGIKITPDTKMVLINNENDELMRAPMEYLIYKMGYKGEIIHLYGLEGGWEGGEVRKAVVREMSTIQNLSRSEIYTRLPSAEHLYMLQC